MAKVAAHGSRIWLDEFALSGSLFGFNQNINVQTPVVTDFLSTGPERVEADYDHDHAVQGLFDGDDDAIDEIVHSLLGDGAAHYLGKYPNSGDEGTVGYEAIVVLGSQSRAGQAGNAVTLDLAMPGSGGIARTNILRNATISGTGASTGQNRGTTSSGEILQVVARVISGTFSNLTFDVQQSSDDGSGDAYADISGLDFTFSAAGVSRKTVTAATEAWKRINVDAFSGTSCVLVVTIGVVKP